MANEGLPIEWIVFQEAGRKGQLMKLLTSIPRKNWSKRGRHETTFLHCAACGDDLAAVAALIKHGLDVNAHDRWGVTAAHSAVLYRQPCALELLCAAGADLRARDDQDISLLDAALPIVPSGDHACACVLVANGARLSIVHEWNRELIAPELVAFERGVLRCRRAVVAMLALRKRGGTLLSHIGCKYMAVELTVAVHATRYDSAW